MVIAIGSSPIGRRFEPHRRYQRTLPNAAKRKPLRGNAVFIRRLRAARYGPMVKRLRHRPFTAVTRVRVPVGSPNKLKANPFPLGDGFAFIVYFKKPY